jgi:hypothetical protein
MDLICWGSTEGQSSRWQASKDLRSKTNPQTTSGSERYVWERTMNTKKRTVKRDDPEQSKAFIEKAREIEADEKRSAADKLMGQMAKMKPEPRQK